MSKTTLELLNEVGKNLRRSDGSTYTSLTQDQDAIFIVQAINEAKREVEGAWQWETMKDVITFPLAAGTRTYDTSDLGVVTSDPVVTNDRSTIVRVPPGRRIQVWDTTDSNGYRLREVSREAVDGARYSGGAQVSQPSQVAIYPSGDGLTFDFLDEPGAVRTITAQVYNPQAELAATGTVLLAPWRLVVLLATAWAARERGEEMGIDASTWQDAYENALGIAIGAHSGEDDMTLVADTTDYIRAGGGAVWTDSARLIR